MSPNFTPASSANHAGSAHQTDVNKPSKKRKKRTGQASRVTKKTTSTIPSKSEARPSNAAIPDTVTQVPSRGSNAVIFAGDGNTVNMGPPPNTPGPAPMEPQAHRLIRQVVAIVGIVVVICLFVDAAAQNPALYAQVSSIIGLLGPLIGMAKPNG